MSSALETADGDAELCRRFLAIDWSFEASAADPVHDVHAYPARFIPEIPGAALELAPGGGAVVDPFCGVGTTLVEAARAGRVAVGTDINPIATLVARAKLLGWTGADTALLSDHRRMLRAAARAGDPERLAAARDQIPRLDHWFSPVAQHALAGATAYVSSLADDDPWRVRLATALSSVVVRISRQESDTRYAAIDKQVSAESIDRALGDAVDRVGRAGFLLSHQVPGRIDATVVTGEAAQIDRHVGAEGVGAAIFSPPYPNAYEYWLYHKYRMYWLGFDPLAVRGAEIGARPFYSGSGRLTERDFARQMGEVLTALRRVLRADGIVVAVVGDSRIRGRLVDNREVMVGAAERAGLRPIASTPRTIRRTRRSFNLAVARAKTEHVLLFGRS